jgi:hypothetical protein
MQKHSGTHLYLKGLILVQGLALPFFLATAVTGSALTIAWDQNLETNVVAYKVYYAPTSNSYSVFTNVGNATQVTLENLPAGHWFLAVTALTDAGDESDFSASLEVDLAPPGTNSGPSISFIPDQILFEDASASTIPFTIEDSQNYLGNVTVVVQSSDPSLLVANLVPPLLGFSPARTLSLQPVAGANGVCRVFLYVSDGVSTNAVSFQVQVRPSNQPCLLSSSTCGPSFTITLPAGLSGGTMNYEMPTFEDPCDPKPVVTCIPPRGSRFPLGTTHVVCGAVDLFGSVGQCSFDITFKQVPQIALNIRLLSASEPSIELWWTGAGNEQFHLEEAEAMAGAGGALNWTPVTTPAPDANGLCRVTNSLPLPSSPSGGSARFFRLSNSQ